MSYYAMTRILYLDAVNPNSRVLEQAAATIRAGGLVAFPTETVYGLGADARNPEAVARIYQAKGRPAHNPLIVHIADRADLATVARAEPPTALLDAFWPGPLTLVLPRHPDIAPAVSAGRETVAVRLPDHPVARALIAAAGPIAAPSANRFTRPSATTAAHVLEDLDGVVNLILDGGSTRIGLESTVLDLTGNVPVVLRPGGVSVEQLRFYLPGLTVAASAIALDDAAARPASPGMLIKHYAPDAELVMFAGPPAAVIHYMQHVAAQQSAKGRRVGVLGIDEDAPHFEELPVIYQTLGPADDLERIAHNLFAALRALDARGVDLILVRRPGAAGLGLAIGDRLLRAANGHLVEIGR